MDGLASLSVQSNFGVADWAIVIAFLVASTIAGMWAMRYIRDMDDYVVAGRSVRTYLGVASMIAAELGLVTVMYSAQKGFACGFAAFAIAGLSAIAGLIVGRTGFIVVPLRKMGVMTIPEFYEGRYGKDVRLLGGAILAASGILNMGMFLYADSVFVTNVMGMHDPDTIKWAMTIILGLVLLYTAVGGMISVVFTDYLQYTIMAIGLLLTSFLLMRHFGWIHILQDVQQIKGAEGINPLLSPKMGPWYLLWMLFLGFIGSCIWQTSVMRATSAESEKVVRRTYSWGSVGFLVRFLIPYFWGICAMVFVYRDPQLRAIFLPAGGAAPKVELAAMPIALSKLMPAGLIGLLTAGMLAAAMSTYNTYLHTWSAVLTQDVVSPLSRAPLSPKQRILIARVIMCVIAFFLLVWGLWYPLGEDLWDYMAITGAIYFTGAFAALAGGIYWKGGSRVGAYGAFIVSLFNVVALKPMQDLLGVTWPGNGEWPGLVIVPVTCIVYVVLSVCFPDRRTEGN
ncbi:MAG: sodium:solute symporter family protein [Armatimonadetes bacterium]|nr:sodium:solute symporter family protein [Armatimonadota bacterium]